MRRCGGVAGHQVSTFMRDEGPLLLLVAVAAFTLAAIGLEGVAYIVALVLVLIGGRLLIRRWQRRSSPSREPHVRV